MKGITAFAVACLSLSASPAIASVQTAIIPVPINVPLINDGVAVANPNPDPLTIVAICGATNSAKNLEGWVWPTGGTPRLVAALSGTSRLTITFVAPVGWNFRISTVVTTGGPLPTGACSATAWWTE